MYLSQDKATPHTPLEELGLSAVLAKFYPTVADLQCAAAAELYGHKGITPAYVLETVQPTLRYYGIALHGEPTIAPHGDIHPVIEAFRSEKEADYPGIIEALADSTLTAAKIAEKFDISANRAADWRRRAGYSSRYAHATSDPAATGYVTVDLRAVAHGPITVAQGIELPVEITADTTAGTLLDLAQSGGYNFKLPRGKGDWVASATKTSGDPDGAPPEGDSDDDDLDEL